MEDFHNIDECFDNDKMLFCVFDGHGGADTAKYVKDRVPDLLKKYISTESIENALIKCFHKIDNELKFIDSDNTGTTATVVIIMKENNNRVLYSANVGDSKAIIVGIDSFKALTEDHKCTNKKEIDRINQSKGTISNGRVKGQLAITRTLGDLALKNYGVIATPFICKHKIENDDKYIILSSDGLWDVINEQDVLKMSKEVSNSEKFSKVLIKKAIEGGSKDNISCIVISL
jgi:serine/threonine protein phosphatase PrpC